MKCLERRTGKEWITFSLVEHNPCYMLDSFYPYELKRSTDYLAIKDDPMYAEWRFRVDGYYQGKYYSDFELTGEL